MKRKNRRDISKIAIPAIIDTPQGKLITPHTDRLGNKIGPCMFMNVNQFLDFIRENEGAE